MVKSQRTVDREPFEDSRQQTQNLAEGQTHPGGRIVYSLQFSVFLAAGRLRLWTQD